MSTSQHFQMLVFYLFYLSLDFLVFSPPPFLPFRAELVLQQSRSTAVRKLLHSLLLLDCALFLFLESDLYEGSVLCHQSFSPSSSFSMVVVRVVSKTYFKSCIFLLFWRVQNENKINQHSLSIPFDQDLVVYHLSYHHVHNSQTVHNQHPYSLLPVHGSHHVHRSYWQWTSVSRPVSYVLDVQLSDSPIRV